jgi:hypothetical protein
MTLAPGFPTEPIKPMPIKRPLRIRSRKVTPVAMTPTEILERLKRIPAPPMSKILSKDLKHVKRPLGLFIPLEELKRVAKPPEPFVSLWQLTNVGKPAAPDISLKRPEQVVGPIGPGAMLKHLREKEKHAVKTRIYRKKRPEEVPDFLDRLREAVSRKKRRG